MANLVRVFSLHVCTMLLAASTVVTAADFRLPPADEAATDTSWVRFKARLLDALAKRDQKALMAMVDNRVRNISGVQGPAEFRKLWEPQSADSALWSELPKLMYLGGTYVKQNRSASEYCAPYLRFKWPEQAPDELDGAIISKEVLVKSRPSASAETQQTLSYHLVKVLDWEVADENKSSQQKWVKIEARQQGYVPEEQIRSPLEHRACFAKTQAGWKLVAFGVGE